MSEDKRSNKIANEYGAEQIQVLEGLEPVRKRLACISVLQTRLAPFSI